jgi:hypothetical protein
VTDKQKVIAYRIIEQNLDLYASFFDHGWARELSERTPPALADAVDSLCLAWKEAAATHRLPWLMIHQMEAFSRGLTRGHKPHMASLIENLNGWLKNELNGALQRAERKKLVAAIKKIDQRLRIASQERDVAFPARQYWNDLISQTEFQLSISGSQGQSYCALVFAYEWFLSGCLQALGGDEEAWPSTTQFWEEWENRLARAGRADYWDDKPVKIAREARNCLAHRGGKAKKKLVDLAPRFAINPDGIICIRPSDNRQLFEVLKEKVDRIVGQVKSELA